MSLFNKTEAHAGQEFFETGKEIVISSQKWKKGEDRSSFEVTEAVEYKLSGEDRYCTDYGVKYKVISKETVKRLKFIPSIFEVAYVYSYPKCASMVHPEKPAPLTQETSLFWKKGRLQKRNRVLIIKSFNLYVPLMLTACESI